jgi:hypothetical protein
MTNGHEVLLAFQQESIEAPRSPDLYASSTRINSRMEYVPLLKNNSKPNRKRPRPCAGAPRSTIIAIMSSRVTSAVSRARQEAVLHPWYGGRNTGKKRETKARKRDQLAISQSKKTSAHHQSHLSSLLAVSVQVGDPPAVRGN